MTERPAGEPEPGRGRPARIIGPGRAGGSVAAALRAVGWVVEAPWGRERSATDLAEALTGIDLLVIATPDAAIAAVAAAVSPSDDAVVLHLAGSRGLDVLVDAGHRRVAALHPLVSMPSPEVGAVRLREGAWFAVAGEPVAAEIVASWGGRSFEVADAARALYHAAACIAANHLVGLLGQVERVAAEAGVPFDAFLPLVAATVGNVADLGPRGALTGPVARGDVATVEGHRDALRGVDPAELPAYDAMADLCRRLAEG